MSRPQPWKRLVTVALLLSICSAVFVFPNTKVKAASTPPSVSTSKISPDLLEMIRSGNGDRRVKLIVQKNESSSDGSGGLLSGLLGGDGLLGGLLKTVGGLLVGVLSILNIDIVEGPASSAEAIAA